MVIKESLSTGDGRVSGQHAKGGGLPCSVHPEQAKTLENIQRTQQQVTDISTHAAAVVSSWDHSLETM